jgi:HD domain-containing protein
MRRMPVPSRREAARTYLSLGPPAWSARHACAVADVAAWLARSARQHGATLDVAAIEAAALLHDVDKVAGRPPDVRHGDGSAAWLAAHGLGELAPLVRDHPVTRLADDADTARLMSAPLEARIVAYADKRAGQRLESMDERFASWRRRYPEGPAETPAGQPVPGKRGWDHELAERVYERALALEREICEIAGVRPAQVRRLRWSRRALGEVAR